MQKSFNTNRKVLRLAIGADHAGVEVKNRLRGWLQMKAGGAYNVEDVGTEGPDSVDYPDFAEAVGKAVARGRVDRGILLCGTGIGMAIAANKVPGVRAAVAWNVTSAGLAAEHNAANVLCLPARFVPLSQLKKMIQIFLTQPFGEGRHTRRLAKIKAMEKRACR